MLTLIKAILSKVLRRLSRGKKKKSKTKKFKDKKRRILNFKHFGFTLWARFVFWINGLKTLRV